MMVRASSIKAAAAAIAGVLLALLLSGCGTSWLLMNDLKQFIDDAAPLQIWSGKVTMEDSGDAASDVLVVVRSIHIAADHDAGEGHDVSSAEPARSTAALLEEKTDAHVGYTGADGRYRIYYKWYEDRNYTVEAILVDEDGTTWYAIEERGQVTWQDHENDLVLAEHT